MISDSKTHNTHQTFSVATLGCKVNSADSEAIAADFIAKGYVPAAQNETPDIIVVNTCTVTHWGDRSSRQTISRSRKTAPNAVIVATGCYASIDPAGLAAATSADFIVPNTEKETIAEKIAVYQQNDALPAADSPHSVPIAFLPNTPFPPAENPDMLLAQLIGKTRAQIKVQDGCDNRCTYCIVPSARGNSRSRAIEDITAFVRRKQEAGIQEIVLTGVHLGDYHTEDGADLGDLLQALLRDTAIPRIRVSSLEPEDFQISWLKIWENPRMCRHLHLPMQSGSNTILRKMARKYLRERYRDIIQAAYSAIPGLAVTTDVIVGFPAESADDFAQTYALCQELEFAKIHVFRFSPRNGTAAARMHSKISSETMRERSDTLLALNDTLSAKFRSRFLGSVAEVLWEARRPNGWEGLTDNYIRVFWDETKSAVQGDLHHKITKMRLELLYEDGIIGAFFDPNMLQY